ncbi:MAG: 30S ribosomal protein S18 [bacterium]
MENKSIKQEKVCLFCQNNIKEIDYKDTMSLRRFLSGYMKILPKRRTGTCSKHQRKLATAIKRSRIMALLPFVYNQGVK